MIIVILKLIYIAAYDDAGIFKTLFQSISSSRDFTETEIRQPVRQVGPEELVGGIVEIAGHLQIYA